MVVARQAEVENPVALGALLQQCGATSIHLTPSYAELLLAHAGAALRGVRLLVGGEAFPGALAQRLWEASDTMLPLRVINVGGA